MPICRHSLRSTSDNPARKDGMVTFGWKDYAHENAQEQMTFPAVEFTRRFLLHVLPRGFVRIRHYVFLANRLRREKLARCKRLLGELKHDHVVPSGRRDESEPDPRQHSQICPLCGLGHMIVVEQLEPRRALLAGPLMPIPRMDSS